MAPSLALEGLANAAAEAASGALSPPRFVLLLHPHLLLTEVSLTLLASLNPAQSHADEETETS